jgi:hypothetical protein
MLLTPGSKLSKELKEEIESENCVLCGYWGGLRPNLPRFPGSVVERPKFSPGLEMTMKGLAVDKIVEAGIGLCRKVEEKPCFG